MLPEYILTYNKKNTMKKVLLKSIMILLLWGICPLFAFAQSKMNVMLDYHYQFGLSETGGPYNISRKDSKMYGNSLHLSVMYNFTERFAAGLGFRADRYENPGYNSFPVFTSLHYSPLATLPNVYSYTNLGYAAISKNDTYKGLMWDLGIGYKKMLRSHFGLNFQLGYNLKEFRDNSGYDFDYTRHSVSLGIGLIF